MKLFIKLLLMNLSIFCIIQAQITVDVFLRPYKTIIDTDIGPWSDDVGTLAMLYNYMNMNLIKILAIVSNNAYEGAAGILDIMNTYYHHSNIPIGITKDSNAVMNKGATGWIDYALANFPHPKYSTNNQADDAVKVYRRVLAQASDKSVIITSLGYFTNLLNLINSPPDEISPLDGAQLIRRKVRSLIAMAGRYPSGKETNIIGRPQEVIEFLRKWSLPIKFVGSEAGNQLKCGSNLLDSTTNKTYYPDNPVGIMYELAYDIYGLDGCYDHSIAVLLARGQSPWFRSHYGNIYINKTGYNHWRSSFLNIWTQRSYVELIKSKDLLDEINTIMIRGYTKNDL